MATARRKSATRKAGTEVQRYNSIDVGHIRRRQIVDAVRKIISRNGLESVTILNIANELGTSRGVVVYHFDNKETILHEVLSSAMSDANASALRFETETAGEVYLAQLVAQVATLARGSSDWWKIHFAFLSHAYTNEFYSQALAWSDERYRKALAKRLGNEQRASTVLAMMKGLAMQASVTDLNIISILEELHTLMERWLREGKKTDG